MAYLGNVPARSFISFERQVFTIVNSQTAYTLSHSVTNENDIRLVVNNVVQEPGSGKAYTASGTALTLSAALTNGTDEMYCVFLGRAVGTVNAPAGSVGTSQLAADAVTNAKIADDAISDEQLDPTVITGQTAETSIATDDLILLSDTSASGALKKMTRANFVSGVGGVMTPYFYAYRSANYSISSATWTKLVLDAEDFDTASGFNVSTGEYTVQTAGNYYFEFSIRSESAGGSATSSRQYAYLERERSGSATQRANPGLDPRNNYLTGGTLHGSVILDCQVGDTIKIYLYHATTSGNVTVYEGSYRPTYFLGYKIIT